jgi:hypothetical protein
MDDYLKVTQADLDRATFRVNLKPVPRKRRVTMLLDKTTHTERSTHCASQIKIDSEPEDSTTHEALISDITAAKALARLDP